jgi:hypothetical protein
MVLIAWKMVINMGWNMVNIEFNMVNSEQNIMNIEWILVIIN